MLSALSMYALHLLAYQIITDSKTQFGMSEYRYVIPLESRTEEEYFSLREVWFNESKRPLFELIPVIEGTVDYQGKAVPLIGLDPIVSVRGDKSKSGVDRFSGEASFLLGKSVIGFGDVLQVGDAVYGKHVSRVIESQHDYILADIGTAQELLQREEQVDSIWLMSSVSDQYEWLDWLLPGLVGETNSREIATPLSKFGAQPFTWWNPAEQFSRAIAFQLGVLSLLALAVSTFVIYQITNTAAFRRRREHLRVRTLGVSPTQYTVAFLTTYTSLAILSSLTGVVLGHFVLEFTLPDGAPYYGSVAVLIALTKTILMTTLATSLVVWWVHRRTKLSITLGAKIMIGFAATLATAMLLATDSGLVGAELAIVLACIANILLLVPLFLFFLGRVLHSRSTSSHISLMNKRSFISLLNVTRPIAFALSFALAIAIGIDLMVSSFRDNFVEMLETRLTEGIYLSNVRNLSANDLKQIDGVSETRGYVRGKGTTDAGVFDFRIAEFDRWETDRYGYDGSSRPSLFINEAASRRMSIKTGDLVRMRLFDDEFVELEVDHVFRDYGAAAPRFILSGEYFPDHEYPIDQYILLGDVEAIHQSVRALQSQYPELSVRSDSEIRNIAEYVFDQTFFMTRVMAGIALVVAVFGLACSLTVYLSTRDTELRLLLTLGISRQEILASNMFQTIGLGTVTVLCALPLSIFVAWILCEVLHPRAFNWHIDFHVTWWSLIYPSLFCIGAASIAGFEPMRRALMRVMSQPISDIA